MVTIFFHIYEQKPFYSQDGWCLLVYIAFEVVLLILLVCSGQMVGCEYSSLVACDNMVTVRHQRSPKVT